MKLKYTLIIFTNIKNKTLLWNGEIYLLFFLKLSTIDMIIYFSWGRYKLITEESSLNYNHQLEHILYFILWGVNILYSIILHKLTKESLNLNIELDKDLVERKRVKYQNINNPLYNLFNLLKIL